MEKFYIRSNKYSTIERKTKRGKVFDIVFRVITIDGEEKQKKLSGFSSKALAKQGYLDFVQEYCELLKHNPFKKKNSDKEEPLVGDLFKEYLSTLGNDNKFTTVYDKENIFRIFIAPYFADKKIKALTTQELVGWQDAVWNTKNKKTDEYYSYKYLSRVRGHFNTFLSWVEKRYGYKNNMPDVPKKKKRASRTEMKFWTKEQFDKFISNVTEPTYHALFTFMFYTGRRKGELFALTPADVQPKSIKVNKSLTRKTKTNKSYEITSTKAEKKQTLPICKTVQAEIANYKPSAPFYFGGEKPLAATTVARVFEKYTNFAGLPKIRIHDLRHSFVSMAIHLGGNFMVIADLIGDTVEQVMKTYGHLYQEDLINIVNSIG